jgi:UDP-N-acetyl-D-glucosamine/UDP-N-acetyl-D-galactosamine dehydrogenase
MQVSPIEASTFYEALANGEATISVTGLGYVGLPVALALARKFKVIGFDVREERVAMLNAGQDPSGELEAAEFEGTDIRFTADPALLAEAVFHIVAVPTPIDRYTKPDLGPLVAASGSVGRYLKSGSVVVFESTVYPGCTEEDCVPVLEQESGLTMGVDFTVGYSPERINPGDKEHTLTRITKVVSGSDAETLELVSRVYGAIIEAGVHRASSIKVAEAAKIIENTQRDLNIALMNELAMIFGKMKISTYEVLEAAGTKWNFLRFSPGLVGGHCIGVDPYYLTHKSMELGHDPAVILSGRRINDGMPAYIAKKVVQRLVKLDKDLNNCRVLVLGATFKENVHDIRNSKVADLYHELVGYSLVVDVVDPFASAEEISHEYNITLAERPMPPYDAIILAVAHHQYLSLTEQDFIQLLRQPGLIADVKGVLRGKINETAYWSL